MGQIGYDKVVVIDWYQPDSTATSLEANDRLWNETTHALKGVLQHSFDAFRSRSRRNGRITHPLGDVRMRHILCVNFLALALVSPSFGQEPVIKTGSCPSGYSTSGQYCVPGRNARPALPKIGSCPSGYSTSGDYCLIGTNGKPAIPKVGSCPSGYATSGSYCLRSR